MIEMMASLGILGEYKGSQAREVMVTEAEYEQMLEGGDEYEEADEYEEEYEEDVEQGEEEYDEDEKEGQEDEDEEAYQHAYVNEGQRSYAMLEDEDEEEEEE